MASEIETAVRNYRRQIDNAEKEALLRMARLWVPVRQEFQQRVSDLTEALARDEAEGKPVWIGYIHSLELYQSMLKQAEAEITRYNDRALSLISAEMENAAGVGAEQARELLTLTFPDTPASELWTSVDRQAAIDAAAVTAQGAPLGKLFQKSFPDTKAAIESALITGIGGGLGWKWTANRMTEAADISFMRAERIARTETNRALRNAAFQQYQASPVFTGYRRMCYPPTACLACLALDGEYYPMSEGVLSDHPNGKCSMIPWRDPNKPPDWQTGRQWLMEQTEEDQRRIMGAGRFELWKQGTSVRSMVYLKESPIWGGQPAVKTLEAIRVGEAGKDLHKNILEKFGFYSEKSSTILDEQPKAEQKFVSKIINTAWEQGVSISQSEDWDRYLDTIGAEATTFSSGEIILHTKVSYSGLFEELWHYGEQKRNGFQELSELDIWKQEVYVKTKLITHAKAYRISEYEVNVIKESIAVYEEKIREKSR